MNLFITGIGTNVGKTIVSAVLTEALQADYWKPIQSGVVEGKDSDTVQSLISNSKTVFYPETYLLTEPLSPHFAAKLDDVEIELNKIQSQFAQMNLSLHSESKNDTKHLIIEGAGGLLVPINKSHYVIDIARRINCEIIVVITNYLGCINHTLLTIDYLQRNEFKIKALVFNGEFEPEIKQAIAEFMPNLTIINIPTISELTKESIKKVSDGLTNLF
jgi:dethiobiotin synthetase